MPSLCCEDCAESTVKDWYLSSCLYMHAYVYAFSPGIRNFIHLSSFPNIHLLLSLDITPLLSSITFSLPMLHLLPQPICHLYLPHALLLLSILYSPPMPHPPPMLPPPPSVHNQYSGFSLSIRSRLQIS